MHVATYYSDGHAIRQQLIILSSYLQYVVMVVSSFNANRLAFSTITLPKYTKQLIVGLTFSKTELSIQVTSYISLLQH